MVVTAIIVRLVLGIFLAGVGSFLGWMVARLLFDAITFTFTSFLVVTVPCIGGLAGVGAVMAWWNTQTPKNLERWGAGLTVLAAMLSCWIAFQIAINSRDFTWIGRGFLFPMMNAAVIGGNAAAGGFFTIRAVVWREV